MPGIATTRRADTPGKGNTGESGKDGCCSSVEHGGRVCAVDRKRESELSAVLVMLEYMLTTPLSASIRFPYKVVLYLAIRRGGRQEAEDAA